VAKKDRNSERDERRERLERMRREAERGERRRSLIVVAVCVVIALVIAALTGWKLYQDNQRDDELASTDLAGIGVGADEAGCQDILTKGAEGAGVHLDGEPIDYPDAPPAFGAHWNAPAEISLKFYTADDRPELQRLVHNLEHGYTILWYDQSVADDDSALSTVQDLADKFDAGTPSTQADYNSAKFIAAPWTSDDGDPFPGGAHVALTHWAAEGEDAAEGQGMGAWQYCDEPSGEVLAAFMEEFPSTNALEPNGG